MMSAPPGDDNCAVSWLVVFSVKAVQPRASGTAGQMRWCDVEERSGVDPRF